MRCVLRLLLAASVGLGLLMPPVVRAQSAQIPAQKTAPGWIFTPSVSFGGTWDDNVLLVNPGTNPPADYGSPITPAASLDYTGKLTRFSTGYSGSFVRYLTLTEMNSLQQDLRANVERKANARLTFFARESFTSAPTTDVLQLAGVPFYRIGSRSNSASGGVQAALAKHTVLRSTYTLHMVDFDNNAFTANSLQGGHAHDITTSVEQALSRRLTVGGEYEFSRAIVNGAQPILGLPVPEDRFNMQTALATAQYLAAAGTTISAAFGVTMIGAGLSHEARTGPEWRAGFAQKTGRGVVSASYTRSYIPSFGFGGTFQNQQFTANIRMPIGRAYVDGGYSWLNNESLERSQPSLQSIWLTTTAGYHVARWLALEGFYAHTQQDSQLAGGQLRRNQLGFQVIATKPLRLR
jgi:hypothetical protein